MPRDISDEEYAFLQSRRQIADFVEGIYNNPRFTKKAKRLIKEAYPQIQIPDLDIEDQVDQRFEQERHQREEREAQERQRAEDQHWQDQRSRTQKQWGFTDEAMQDLERMMVERNIGDYEVAASYKAQKDPKPVEAEFGQHRWHMEKRPEWAEISKDPEDWARNELMQAMRRDKERERG